MPAPRPLVLREGDRGRVQEVAASDSSSRDAVMRAQIVLLAADGHSNTAIAKELGISRPTVISWRTRYVAHGMDGLIDAPKPGRPRVAQSHAIIAALLTPPPATFEVPHWNSRLLAQHLQISKTTVQAAWKEYGVKPCGPDRFTFATTPTLAASVTAVVDLHIGAQGNAIILAVAATPGRTEQTQQIRSDVRSEQFHRYLQCRERLLAADTHISTGSTFRQQPHPCPDEDIAAFCQRGATTHPDQRLHVIFDADTEHLEPVRSALSTHSHVRTHHTSTPTAWLHLVDVWIAIAEHRHASTGRAPRRVSGTREQD
ncbi:helix-turn-helix domain-containing protein [Rhodococcus qingshengii]|uniref:helix-turn-helix domain-containing protein n=1 Tax=Rhodococcus qingshengii TaxID=334542 RepID=UPI00237CCF9C|nr:helix-turn-helix domain-containing protein [Rhodococcus qingshengii]WCT06091.1 helix-turn-helix domain-containing protein [Rhodococcus qingshengii]